jgi:hypothetical protein
MIRKSFAVLGTRHRRPRRSATAADWPDANRDATAGNLARHSVYVRCEDFWQSWIMPVTSTARTGTT